MEILLESPISGSEFMAISSLIVKQKLQYHLCLAYTLGGISPDALPQKMQGTTFYKVHSVNLSRPPRLKMQRFLR